MSEGGCALVLQKDLEYWCIDELTMEPCCALKYYPQIDVCQSEKDGDIAAKKLEMELATEEDFGNSCLGRMRSWTWNTFEYPWTSKVAQVMAFLSLFMVVVSTFTFVLSTIEELQESQEGTSEYPIVIQIIEIIDHVVVIFFTLEYLIRLIVCPRKVKFMKNAMNMVDLLAILPFYISLVIEGLEVQFCCSIQEIFIVNLTVLIQVSRDFLVSLISRKDKKSNIYSRFRITKLSGKLVKSYASSAS